MCVRSHGARKDNRVVEFQIEPGGSSLRPAPCATLVEVGANRREPAKRPWAGRRRHPGACACGFLDHSLKLFGWFQMASSATRVQRCQEGRQGSPPPRRGRLRACLDHTFGHQEDRIVVIAEDLLDAEKGVELPFVDATCTVRKPYRDPPQMPRSRIRFRQPECMLVSSRDATVSLAASEPAGRSSSPGREARSGLIADLSCHSYELR